MGKFFNVTGPCNSEDHNMLPATARVPGVVRLKSAGGIVWKGKAVQLVRC